MGTAQRRGYQPHKRHDGSALLLTCLDRSATEDTEIREDGQIINGCVGGRVHNALDRNNERRTHSGTLH